MNVAIVAIVAMFLFALSQELPSAGNMLIASPVSTGPAEVILYIDPPRKQIVYSEWPPPIPDRNPMR